MTSFEDTLLELLDDIAGSLRTIARSLEDNKTDQSIIIDDVVERAKEAIEDD